jgi:DNA-directed RNA polymerase specialized sigma24 family protein
VSMMGGRDLARLYEQHAPVALRLAYVLTGDHAVAEELVQDAFVRVIGRLGQLRGEVGFDTCMRRTVVHLSRGTFRRRGVARTAAHGVPEERDELWRRLDSMAPRQRAALVLRYYEDLSEEQIADVLGCTRGTVKSQASAALANLRRDAADLTIGDRS